MGMVCYNITDISKSMIFENIIFIIEEYLLKKYNKNLISLNINFFFKPASFVTGMLLIMFFYNNISITIDLNKSLILYDKKTNHFKSISNGNLFEIFFAYKPGIVIMKFHDDIKKIRFNGSLSKFFEISAKSNL